MIGSKLVPFVKFGFRNGRRLFTTSAKKFEGHDYSYREFQKPEKKFIFWANAAGTFFWWWIFYHIFTDDEHFFGPFSYPEIEKWTDAELGIPPDDAEDPDYTLT